MSPFAEAKQRNPFLRKTDFRTAVRKIKHEHELVSMPIPSTAEAGRMASKRGWL